MTKDLANKLITHYESVIAQIEGVENVDSIRKLLFDTYTMCGVCKCAYLKFGVTNIYNDSWVLSFGTANWFVYPYYFHTKHEILEALQLRVDRLKTFKK